MQFLILISVFKKSRYAYAPVLIMVHIYILNLSGLRMGDLKALGRMTDARMKEIQKEKDAKKRVKPDRPEKVYQPRI